MRGYWYTKKCAYFCIMFKINLELYNELLSVTHPRNVVISRSIGVSSTNGYPLYEYEWGYKYEYRSKRINNILCRINENV